jgi:5-methylcytosine-specific restriction endonuclease McrA
MIQLTRQRSSAIPSGLRGPARLKKNAELIDRYRSHQPFEFRSQYWKAGKNQLRKESFGKCAYCEGPTDLVAYGDVEHFRPKSVYWWLAYCYDNHLFACQICNQGFKGDRFPIFGARMRSPKLSGHQPGIDLVAAQCGPDPLDDSLGLSRAAFFRDARREMPGLLDPYLVDPEPFFKWVADPVQKEVVCRAAKPSPKGRRIFQCCEALFGLNREELNRWRFRTYEKLEVLVQCLDEKLKSRTRTRVQRQIRDMTSPRSEFAGMVRYFVRTWGVDLR